MMVISRGSGIYPELLSQVKGCPDNLYCLGEEGLLKEAMIAVVGCRDISFYGERVIKKLVPQLVRRGLVIVSGMAFGVDAMVHEACIQSGGKTIAVLASGPDMPTPKGNTWIYKKILDNGGLIVSEKAFGQHPTREDFLKRNRIVAGMSQGVLVVEGKCRSGSMVTAKIALDLGRDVWAVPGRIDEANSWTPNYLIKNGAGLVTEAEDLGI